MVVENGKQIAIEYKLTLEDGSVADTNVGGDPLVYKQGEGQILPALEQALAGHSVNERVDVELAPEEGYGPVDPQAFRSVEKEAVPEDARSAGTMLVARDPEGNQQPVRVHEVQDESIVLDFNHPLAGEKLSFEVKIVDVE